MQGKCGYLHPQQASTSIAVVLHLQGRQYMARVHARCIAATTCSRMLGLEQAAFPKYAYAAGSEACRAHTAY